MKPRDQHHERNHHRKAGPMTDRRRHRPDTLDRLDLLQRLEEWEPLGLSPGSYRRRAHGLREEDE